MWEARWGWFKAGFLYLLFIYAFLTPILLAAEPVEVRTIFDKQYCPIALKIISEAKKSINFAVFEIRYYP